MILEVFAVSVIQYACRARARFDACIGGGGRVASN